MGHNLYKGTNHKVQLSSAAEQLAFKNVPPSYVVKLERVITGLSVAEKDWIMGCFTSLPKSFGSMKKSFNYFHSLPPEGQLSPF